MPTFFDIATSDPNFSNLVDVIQFLDGTVPGSTLAATLDDPAQDLTLFAPTNAAFSILATDLGFTGDTSDPSNIKDFLTTNVDATTLTDIVLYHVLPGAQTAATIATGTTIATLQSGTISTDELPTLGDNEPDLLDPSLISTDIPADNGVLHVIDRVLLPVDLPGNDAPTIAGVVASSGGTFDTDSTDFDLLLTAANAASLVAALDDSAADLTVFAPNDAAFISTAQQLGYTGTDEAGAFEHIICALTLLGAGEDPTGLLTAILTYHVLPSSLQSSQVLAQTSFTTLQGTSLIRSGTSLQDAEPELTDPNLIALDIQAANGIVHVIDNVLIPIDLLQSDGADDVDFLIGTDTAEAFNTGLDADLISAKGGDDSVLAGQGNDIVLGGAGNDLVFGFDGNDTLRGEAGNDTIYGEAGDDSMSGGIGDDVLFAGTGNDSVTGDDGEDQLFGKAGNDTLYGGLDSDSLFSGAGDDLAFGGDGDDLVYGGLGNDSAYGEAGDDTMFGGDGNDVLYAGTGNDIVTGDAGQDQLFGKAGNDTLIGGLDNDSLFSGAGDDRTLGGAGDDLIYTGIGNDVALGGTGNDTIFGLDDNDSIEGEDGNDLIYAGTGDDTVLAGNGDDTVFGGAGNDAMFGGAGADVLFGLDGNDLIIGGFGNDSIFAGAGNDTIFGREGQDEIFGGAGEDVFIFTNASASDIVLDFTTGQDVIDLQSFNLASFADLAANFTATAQGTSIDIGSGHLLLVGVASTALDADDFLL